MYKQLIAELDVPTPQIEIEALIIDVNSNRLAEMGIAWNGVTNNQRLAIGLGNVNTPPTANTISFVAGGTGSSGLSGSNMGDMPQSVKTALQQILQSFEQEVLSKGCIIQVDVDPY